ncbi:DUF6151 family protein [Litoreibacter ponti]|nr:DUF6151 family protein [Litoreibacter ponti]
MSDAISLTCQCGSFKARLRGADAKNGNHGVCYCVDCQAFARHLVQLDRVADAAGGTEIYQTQPHRFEITEGAAHLAVLRLSPKGLNRWYAACCNTPICNTPRSPKVAFAGVVAANITAPDGALGPIRFRYKRESALHPVSEPAGNMVGFVVKTLSAILGERLSGRWRDTPFFDDGGNPVVEPRVISREEKAAAYTR